MSWVHENDDDTLCEYAARVFRLGLIDGRKRPKPRDGHEIMAAIATLQDEWRIIDRHKYRQVYGAGFDLARATKRQASKQGDK